VVDNVAQALAEAHSVESRLGQAADPVADPAAGRAAAVADIRSQLSALIYPGFIAETGLRRLPDLVRYLKAITWRLDKMPTAHVRDGERTATVHRITDAYQHVIAGLREPARSSDDAVAARWMIEELRVSLFAQTLGTPAPVSEKRIQAALDRLAAGAGHGHGR